MNEPAVSNDFSGGRKNGLTAPEEAFGADLGLINLQPSSRQNRIALAAVVWLSQSLWQP